MHEDSFQERVKAPLPAALPLSPCTALYLRGLALNEPHASIAYLNLHYKSNRIAKLGDSQKLKLE